MGWRLFMYSRVMGKGKYRYLVIQRNYREGKRCKQETIANLGRIDEIQKDFKIKKLLLSISKQLDPDNRVYDINDAKENDRIYWGANAIIKKLWSMLKMDDLLCKLTKDRKIEFNFYEAIFLMLVDRFTNPCSKYKTFQTQDKYNKADKVALHHFYRALDLLSEYKDQIEIELFKQSKRTLDSTVDIVFYDVTTLYFESISPDVLKEFGYSKDAKFGEVQVVVGLLINSEGLPIGFEVFPGNTYEGDTLIKSLEKLKTRFKIGKLIFVADQGMLNLVNLSAISSAGYEYIIGARIKSRPQKIKEDILDLSTYDTIETSDIKEVLKGKTIKCPDVNDLLEIKKILQNKNISSKDLTAIRKHCEKFNDTLAARRITEFLKENMSDATTLISLTKRTAKIEKIEARIGKVKNKILKDNLVFLGNDRIKVSNQCNKYLADKKEELVSILDETLQSRLILTWSSKRSKKNKKDRERLIAKAKDLIENGKQVINKKGYRKYINASVEKPTLDYSKMIEEEQWDGFYGIQTSNKEMSHKEISAVYHMLWKIEESFRILKSHFETRPIYHWTPSRIKGHLVLCFMALLLERTLEIKLSRENATFSPVSIREAINSLQASKFEVDGDEFYMRSTITELGEKILSP